MTLNEFKTDFRFNNELKVQGMNSRQLDLSNLRNLDLSNVSTAHPKLFMLTASASFNGNIERMIFINNLLTSEISLAIDEVYTKLEQRLTEIKTELEVSKIKNHSQQLFVEARVGFTIKQQLAEAITSISNRNQY